MADEQYRWLDRETAELLLRGASLEAVDAADRDKAERLAKTLDGLTVEPALSSTELPGEAAALAAFRAARSTSGAAREDTAAHPAAPADPETPAASDAGLIRIGAPVSRERRPRRGRSARYVLTAVVTAGMIGGVAFAATSGVLGPFGDDRPSPGASVTAGVTPNRPLVSPSPDDSKREPTPDSSSGGHTGPAAPPGAAASVRPGSDDDRSDDVGRWWSGAPAACSDVRHGKELGPDRRRALQDAAGSSNPRRVWKYCKHVLALTEGATRDRDRDRDRSDDRDDRTKDGSGGPGDSRGPGDESGPGGDQGDQGGDDDGPGILPGSIGGASVSPSLHPLLPRQLISSPQPSPSTSPSAL
ncbi:hypothetical protein [Streptomyces sp. HGB0020]|uniref:hypothetical protein n=1 Tax=Streptomyces sp. HGB0020 TaxID=1078086 RepID=UPI00034E36F2|nr:hypothetical protein [Streptomyces sp. HGB0020]EPD60868.1 hypothetical protein HMPREF1211_04886 [Streptomyces sp. HGB0020]